VIVACGDLLSLRPRRSVRDEQWAPRPRSRDGQNRPRVNARDTAIRFTAQTTWSRHHPIRGPPTPCRDAEAKGRAARKGARICKNVDGSQAEPGDGRCRPLHPLPGSRSGRGPRPDLRSARWRRCYIQGLRLRRGRCAARAGGRERLVELVGRAQSRCPTRSRKTMSPATEQVKRSASGPVTAALLMYIRPPTSGLSVCLEGALKLHEGRSPTSAA